MARRRRFVMSHDTSTSRLTGALVAALLLVTGLAPTASAAPTAPTAPTAPATTASAPDGGALRTAPRTALQTTPRTVPALTNWTVTQGSFTFTHRTRVVVNPHDPAARRAAGTLAQDLRAAGRGTVPTAHGASHPGDIVIATAPRRSKELGREGYELRVGDRVRITGATGTGAFYGTRTLLQLLDTAGDTGARDRVPAGRTVDIPAYRERGVGVCACYRNSFAVHRASARW